MDRICFNCGKNINKKIPICPNCFVVQKNHFTREQVFNYLETIYPTKPIEKGRFVSYNVELVTRNYEWWLIFGILSLGVLYYYYLLLNLKDLNDHWMFPHGRYETTTNNDIFIALIILFLTTFLGVPFIQYIKYEKLRKHLINAPPDSNRAYPLKGKTIFWLYMIFNLMFLGTISVFFFGFSALLAGRFFEFNSSEIAIVFFTGATILFISSILFVIFLTLIEYRWQEIYNYHVKWHINNVNKYQ